MITKFYYKIQKGGSAHLLMIFEAFLHYIKYDEN